MSALDKMNGRFRGKRSGLLETAPAEGLGTPCVDLGSADLFAPDGPLPNSVRLAMEAQLRDPGAAHYQEPLGSRRLRETIARRLEKRYGRAVDPGQNVFITPGSEVGLMASALQFLEPGDEVLVPDPSYSPNFQYVRLAGGTPVSVPLRKETGYQLEMAELKKRWSKKIKAVLLTQPNNPTGTVYSREVLEELCRFLVEKDLILICDMAFEDHIYDGVECLWPAALPGMWERTVSLFTMSKGFGLCGLRVGYLVADAPVLDSLLAEATPLLCAANMTAQAGAMAALEDETLLPACFARLDRRRKETCRRLNQIPGVSVVVPQGGIQCWVDVSQLGDSGEIAVYLREKAGVAVSEGSAYGPEEGKGHFRLVFGCLNDEEAYDQALDRLCKALETYSK